MIGVGRGRCQTRQPRSRRSACRRPGASAQRRPPVGRPPSAPATLSPRRPCSPRGPRPPPWPPGPVEYAPGESSPPAEAGGEEAVPSERTSSPVGPAAPAATHSPGACKAGSGRPDRTEHSAGAYPPAERPQRPPSMPPTHAWQLRGRVAFPPRIAGRSGSHRWVRTAPARTAPGLRRPNDPRSSQGGPRTSGPRTSATAPRPARPARPAGPGPHSHRAEQRPRRPPERGRSYRQYPRGVSTQGHRIVLRPPPGGAILTTPRRRDARG